MNFKQYIDNDLQDKYKAVLNDKMANPYEANIKVNDYSIFKDKYRQYKKRLEDEKYRFNQAIDQVHQNKLSREQVDLERKRQAKIRKDKRMRKLKRIVIFVLIFSALCIGIFQIPEVKYTVAIKLMENEMYDKAIALFESLEDYKNSELYLRKTKYYEALELINTGNKDEAIDVLSTFDVRVKITDYLFDEFGNYTKKISEEDGAVSTLEYNYLYDSSGKVIQKISPLSDGGQSIVSYEYNSEGVLIMEKNESSSGIKTTTEYTYDNKGNCIKKEVKYNYKNYSDCLYEYSYDENDNCVKEVYYTIDKISETKEKFSSCEYSYDDKGNCTKMYFVLHKSLPGVTNNNHTIYYNYDVSNNCTQELVSYPDGDTATTDYLYNGKKQMIESFDYNTFNNHTTFVSYIYDSNGNCVREICIETKI